MTRVVVNMVKKNRGITTLSKVCNKSTTTQRLWCMYLFALMTLIVKFDVYSVARCTYHDSCDLHIAKICVY